MVLLAVTAELGGTADLNVDLLGLAGEPSFGWRHLRVACGRMRFHMLGDAADQQHEVKLTSATTAYGETTAAVSKVTKLQFGDQELREPLHHFRMCPNPAEGRNHRSETSYVTCDPGSQSGLTRYSRR